MKAQYRFFALAICSVAVACGSNSEPPKEPSTASAAAVEAPPTAPPPASAPTIAPGAASPETAMPTKADPGSTARTSSDGSSKTLSESEIVAIAHEANTGEIEAARLATKTTQNGQVKTFATMMITEHGDAETKGKAIAQRAKVTPADSDISKQIHTESETTMASLKGLKGKEFDKAYIDAQVKAHREVLSIIDTKLLPSAHTPELKEHLTDVRKHVAHHLEKAQEIAKGL